MHVPIFDHKMKVNKASFVLVLRYIQTSVCVALLCYKDAALYAAMTFKKFTLLSGLRRSGEPFWTSIVWTLNA